jgi:hypothetical protein
VADLLGLSSRIIDTGVAHEPVNRITQELSEVADGIAVVESFSHCVAITTDEGLVVFDTSGPATGARAADAIRGWSKAPLHDRVHARPPGPRRGLASIRQGVGEPSAAVTS